MTCIKELKTERLILRRMDVTEAPFILQLLNSPAWIQFIGDRGVYSLEQAEMYIKEGPLKSYVDHGFGPLIMHLNDRDETRIGLCGLLKRDQLQDPDIGFALLPPYEGQGYAFEGASALMAYSRGTLKLKRLVAITSGENKKCITLLNKLGFKYEKNIAMNEDGVENVLLFSTQISAFPSKQTNVSKCYC